MPRGDTKSRPLLVIDDEADQASVDTGQQDFDDDDAPDPDYAPTRINGQIRKLLAAFSRSAYVAYTATPFANILIHDAAVANEYGDDLFPRSFIINGWNDYFQITLPEFWPAFQQRLYPFGMPESAINEPSETITFGEKETKSQHVHMDFYQYNDTQELEHGRHSAGRRGSHSGGSNYAFADGSARFLRYGQCLAPINLWGVTDFYRTNSIAVGP